ncbi:MAG: hypothetical protein ACK59A_06230 [Cyanobacteriota bacterium]
MTLRVVGVMLTAPSGGDPRAPGLVGGRSSLLRQHVKEAGGEGRGTGGHV